MLQMYLRDLYLTDAQMRMLRALTSEAMTAAANSGASQVRFAGCSVQVHRVFKTPLFALCGVSIRKPGGESENGILEVPYER